MGEDTHLPGAGKGEEKGLLNKEEGRKEEGASGADRPTGERTARDSTGISAKRREPIDPDMPNMPPA